MNRVIVVTFLCEACAEGRGLEADGPLTTAVCADCAKRKACLMTYQPAQAAPPPEAVPPPLDSHVERVSRCLRRFPQAILFEQGNEPETL
jgi:hypothetical protein